MKNTKLYLINGLCTMTSFFTARILIFPYLYWRYSAHTGVALHEVPASIPIKCNVGSVVVIIPQIMWFRQIVRRALMHFKKD